MKGAKMLYLLNKPYIYTKEDMEYDDIINTIPTDVEDWKRVAIIINASFESTVQFYELDDGNKIKLHKEQVTTGIYEINTNNVSYIGIEIEPHQKLEDDDQMLIAAIGVNPNTTPYIGEMIDEDIAHKSFGHGELPKDHHPNAM